MDHSVRAYLERIPIDRLCLFLENDLFQNAYAIHDGILQDILEALISRNNPEDHDLLPYIRKIQKIQSMQHKSPEEQK